MYKSKWFPICILALFAFLSIIYTVYQDGKEKQRERELEQEEKLNSAMKETFMGGGSNRNINSNLIKNGSFVGGKNIGQFKTEEGENDIIVYPNPGSSSYVLRQSHVSNIGPEQVGETYYEIVIELKSGMRYKLSAVYGSNKQSCDLVYRLIYSTQERNPVLLNTDCTAMDGTCGNGSINGDRISNATVFRKTEAVFTVPVSTTKKTVTTRIQIGYSNRVFMGYRYLTDISLEELLDTTNIPITKDLQVYLDAGDINSYNGNGRIWKDLSKNGHDFVWKKRPVWNKNGSFSLLGNELSGPSGYTLEHNGKVGSNSAFTIFLNLQSVSGNGNGNSNGNVDVIEGFTSQSKTKTQNAFISQQETEEAEQVEEVEMGEEEAEMEEEEGGMIIPAPQMGVSMRSVIKVGGNQDSSFELLLPVRYGKPVLLVAGRRYEVPYSVLTRQRQCYVVSYDGKRMVLYLNGELLYDGVVSRLYFDNSPFVLSSYPGSIYSFVYYNVLLNKDEVLSVVKYMNTRGVGIDNRNMYRGGTQMYMFDNDLVPRFRRGERLVKRRGLAGSGDIGMGSVVGAVDGVIYSGDIRLKGDGNCPLVSYRGGNYYVSVPVGSELSHRVGYSGERNYGSSRASAKYMYEMNFKGCKVPDVLDKGSYKGNMDGCPFVMHDGNPCGYYECRDMDWKSKDGKGINDKCKVRVDNYCQLNNKHDNACVCWRKENMDKPECKKIRGLYESSDRCDFGKHDIEKHPDMKDYIKKSKIPCWGCNLK